MFFQSSHPTHLRAILYGSTVHACPSIRPYRLSAFTKKKNPLLILVEIQLYEPVQFRYLLGCEVRSLAPYQPVAERRQGDVPEVSI
jgi:hypothetical protein